MSKNIINYPSESSSTNRLPVGIDFTKMNVIKENENPQSQSAKDEAHAELISFTRVDKTIRPTKSKIQLGSYISQENLQKILNKSQKDRSYFNLLETIRKSDRLKIVLNEDFNLLRDFFPEEMVLEVEDYTNSIMVKVEMLLKEKGITKITPRKRRAYILATFRSFCRKNGRRFTEELLEEINNRFNYERHIKLFEVSKAEKELIDWNLLIKKPEREMNDLRTFYLHIINNINHLKTNENINSNNEYNEIIKLTQKHITNLATSKEHKKAIAKLVKHQDKDFIARMVVWCIAKHYAERKYNYNFKNPEEILGWDTLFMIKKVNASSEEAISIRSFKFVFWVEFNLRNKLKEMNLYPIE